MHQELLRTEKELLAIVFGVEKFHTDYCLFRPQIFGKYFKKGNYKDNVQAIKVVLRVLKYDFNLVHVPRKYLFLSDILYRAHLREEIKDDLELVIVLHPIEQHLAVSPHRKK